MIVDFERSLQKIYFEINKILLTGSTFVLCYNFEKSV